MLAEEQLGEYFMYAKVQDTLGYLGDNAIINMNIALYREKKSNIRDYYRKEIQYIDKGGRLVRKINRLIDGYLTIEIRKAINGKKPTILIRPNGLELLRMNLLPYLENIITNFKNIYEIRDHKLYLDTSRIKINTMEINLSVSSNMWVSPGILVNYEGESQPSINIYINDLNTITKVAYNDIYGFMYLLRTFDIYNYAVSMLNALETPNIGIGLYDITSQQDLTSINNYTYEEPPNLKKKREESKGFFANELEKRKGE